MKMLAAGEPPTNFAYGSVIGRGWDPIQQVPLGNPFGTGGTDYGAYVDSDLKGQVTSFGFDVLDDFDSVSTAFMNKIEGDGKYGLFSGEASFERMGSNKNALHSVSAVGFCRVLNAPLQISGPKLVPDASQLLKTDLKKFFSRYGNCYVHTLFSGGVLLIHFTYSSHDTEEIRNVRTFLKGSAFNVSSSGEFTSKLSHVTKNTKLSARGYLLGGSVPPPPDSTDPAKLTGWMMNAVVGFRESVQFGKAPRALFIEVADYKLIPGGETINIDAAMAAVAKLDTEEVRQVGMNRDLTNIAARPELYVATAPELATKQANSKANLAALRAARKALSANPFKPGEPPSMAGVAPLPRYRVYAKPSMRLRGKVKKFMGYVDAPPVNNGEKLDGGAGHFGSLAAVSLEFFPRIPELQIRYKFHISAYGDTDWFYDGVPGAPPSNIEGITIELSGAAATFYRLAIWAYPDHIGPGDFKAGEFIGTTGRQGRIEALGVTVTGRTDAVTEK